MNQDLDRFLETSPIAANVDLPAKIVIQRTTLSFKELAAIMRSGKYPSTGRQQRVCELEVEGKVLARGRILRRRGSYFFEVTQLLAGGER